MRAQTNDKGVVKMNYLDKWLLLTKMENSIRQELEAALAVEGQHPVKLNEFYVLYFLNLQEIKASRLQELGQQVGLSASATSRMIVKMESQACGVIQRSICEEDKRGVHITLTPKGEEILAESIEIVQRVLEQHAKKLKNLA